MWNSRDPGFLGSPPLINSRLRQLASLSRVRRALAAVLAGVVLVGSLASTAYAAPTKPKPHPPTCEYVELYDAGGQSVTGGNYTLHVWAEFAHDAYSGTYCWTRSKTEIYESGNEYSGTVYMTLTDCTD